MSRSSSDQIDIANVNEDADGNEYETSVMSIYY